MFLIFAELLGQDIQSELKEVIEHVSHIPYSFYSSLVAYLNDATPMSVLATQSRDVVAIMEAAEESALANGKPVSLVLLRA